MQIYYGADENRPKRKRGVALGYFDGVHRGHVQLIRTLIARCAAQQLPAAAFTFDRHPAGVLRPETPCACISSLQEKLGLLAESGLDEAHVYAFDTTLAACPPRDFLDRVLGEALCAALVVVGPDFRFGAGGSGDISLLRDWSGQHGIELLVADEVVMDGSKVASTKIRDLIRQGAVEQAASWLGRPYALQGTVEEGRKLGHRLGFPTANIPMIPDKVCPALGVYATRVTAKGSTWEAITSIGLRPTVSQDETVPVIETYIYDADLLLYGETLNIELLKFIRPEKRFRSLLQLSTQIKADLDEVRAFHRQAEQCYERLRVHNRPLYVLPSIRFARAALHIVFQVQAAPRQLACNALLIQVLAATSRRYPDRKELALALDNLYGAAFSGSAEKSGDVQTLTLSVEALACWTDGSAPFKAACDLAFDALLEPDTDEDGFFRPDVVEAERHNLIMALVARNNDKMRQAYDRCLQIYCRDQVHGLYASGKVEDLHGITLQELKAAYAALLQDTQMSVYLGGRIDHEDYQHCQALMQRLPAAARPNLIPGRLPTPCRPAEPDQVVACKEGEQAWLAMAFDGLPAYFAQQSAALLLNNMLGGDMHALLFSVIREQMGLAYQVFSIGRPYLSALFVLAGVAPAAVEQAQSAVLEQVARLAGGQFDDILLDRSRRLLESSIRSLHDDLSGMLAVQIANRLSGRNYSLTDALMLLQAVTREQVRQCAAGMSLKTTYILTPAQQPGLPAPAGEGE